LIHGNDRQVVITKAKKSGNRLLAAGSDRM
jgi:hypothetical protein